MKKFTVEIFTNGQIIKHIYWRRNELCPLSIWLYFRYLTDDSVGEYRLVVCPLWTLHYRCIIAGHQGAVPTVELGAVVDAVVEWKHLTRAVLNHRVIVMVDCWVYRRWNGYVLLYVCWQVHQLRHTTPVKHLARYEYDMDRIHRIYAQDEHSKKDS